MGVVSDHRIEHDSLGEVRVPSSALWGAQTQRAVENFPISGETVPVELIHALASIKGVAATVNGRLRVIPKDYKRVLACLKRAHDQGLSGDEAIMAAFEENARDLSRVGGN